MAIDWKRFTQRPYIKSLPLIEQTRLFYIANEKSIRYRSRSGTGDTGATPFNRFSLAFDGTDDRVELDSNLNSSTNNPTKSFIDISSSPLPKSSIFFISSGKH